MNVTFLIGNGFDLNLGLSTTYSNFLKEYQQITDEDNELIKYFKTNVLTNLQLWANAEEAFGIATKQFLSDGYNAEDYCVCHEHFCVNLANYLLSQEQRLNYTALNELLIKGFAPALLNYKKGFREDEKAQLISAESKITGGYVFNFINFNYTQTLDLCINATRAKTGVLSRRSYSNTAADNKLGQIVHVHGTVHKDMVLGVNDTTQISAPELFSGWDDEYISEIVKQQTNAINEERTDSKALELLKSSDLIYVYGMSAGITDKLWWERICSLMDSKKNLHLILHKYDAPADSLIRRTYRLFTSNVKKDFVNYSTLDDNSKKDIISRIHVDKTNIFEGLCNLVENPLNTVEKELVAV